MTEPKGLQFNALTGPWLPLVQPGGETVWASPVEVLSGDKDGIDLDYPRDDFRIFARLLLSALVQALFPAKDKQELRLRLDVPLDRMEVEQRIAPVLGDFDLFGATPFLQVIPPEKVPNKGAAPFVFAVADLYQPLIALDRLSLPVALVALFIENAYAGGAGRGYGSGPGGQPGVMTLIDPGTVRRAAWANTIALDTVHARYAKDDDKPWSNDKRPPRPRAAIGIVGGLFFQPRGIWLVPAGDGCCSFTGHSGPVVRLSPLSSKSELVPKQKKVEDLWIHPCVPMAVNSVGLGAVRLNAAQPAWTGLAQLLAPLSKSKTKVAHPLEGPALVLAQWKSLGLRLPQIRLLVLDFERDKANIKRRFVESFPLTHDLLNAPELLERVRALVADSENVERALQRALVQAHDDRKAGGLALADARARFWSSTESPFYDWLAAVTRLDAETDDGWAQVQRVTAGLASVLRNTAILIFNSHAELSEFDPSKQRRIAKARRSLLQTLFPTPRRSDAEAPR